MSFWEGSADFPNKGAFSDIDLNDFARILDTIIPKNKQYVYTRVKEKVVPYQGVRRSEEGKASKSKFELWKADTNSELFFDLTDVNQFNNIEQVNRILKRQGIYKTDEGYSFPLYKVNNYEGGQVFILEELDGRPITESFFRNLFNSYKSKSELIELLKGSTAKYKVYKRQGLDRISPNGLTSAVATELNEAANGIRSISSTRVKATALPAGIVNIENAKTLLVSDPNQVNDIKDNKFTVNGKELYVFSGTATYKFTLNRSGAISIYKRGKGSFFMIYNQAKEESNDKEVQYLMNKLGFGNITDFFASDSLTKAAVLPKPGSVNQFTLLNYNVNERPVEGVAPDITQPTTKEPVKLKGQMTFSYGDNKRSDVTAATTFDAILNGERTATTRYESQGKLDYWKQAKVGDTITWESGDGRTVDVIVTKALHPLKGSGKNAEAWSKLEGWSKEYFDKNVRPKLNEAWQIEYTLAKPTETTATEEETTIEYTPVGKQRQTYTIRGNQVFNKAGQEVFKEDSVDRNKIFANLALKQGRAVLVEHKGAKYIVNDKNKIISGTTGKMMQWDENNGDRKAIVALAQEKFASQKKQDDDDVTDNNIFNC
jgi:hypothetical protein